MVEDRPYRDYSPGNQSSSKQPVRLGKYILREMLGKGAMGVVYKGYDEDIDRIVALKVLNRSLLDGEHGQEFAARFRQEAKAAARCVHPNIIAIYDFVFSPPSYYIVMEYIEGIELKELLKREVRLSFPEAANLVLQVLSALEYTHENGIIHRDIKPANILLLNTGKVKIADFGVARMDNSDLTQSGYMIGTPNYMSPESKSGFLVDHRADLYSVGVLLLELITGLRVKPKLIRESSIAKLVADNSPALQHRDEVVALLEQALAPSPIDRIASASLFARELKNIVRLSGEAFHDTSKLADTISQAVSGDLRETRVNVNPDVVESMLELPATQSYTLTYLKNLQNILLPYVGPVAGKLVKNYARQTNNEKELLEELSRHIPNASDRKEFVLRAQKKSQIQGEVEGTGSIHVSEPVISEDESKLLAELLSHYVGPMASVLLRKKMQSTTDLNQLLSSLAQAIPDTEEAEEFMRKARQALH